MTKTKHSLLMSAIALLLCFSMLIGTTFAWFTDTVTSSGNVIKSGTLDVTLSYLTAKEDPSSDTAAWKNVEGATDPIFNYTLWEPGYTEVRHIKIENEGSLALKYIINFIPKDVKGNAITNLDLLKVNGVSLADVIDVYYIDPANKAIEDRSDLEGLEKLGTLSEVLQNLSKTANGTLLKDEKDIVTIALKMQETAGNEYQALEIGASFDIQLFATQLNSEKDSIDENYDSAAMWTGEVNTDWYFANVDATEFTIKSAEELAGLAAIVNGTLASSYSLRATAIKDDFKGKIIYLGADIDLNNVDWTPIGDREENVFRGIFDGKNHTVSNLNVTTYGWAGLIGHAGKSSGSDIKNVKIENATINANRLAGALVGQLYGSIDNCHVENVNIMVVPNAVGDTYDNGDKVGGIVGWLGDNNNNRTLTNCTAENVTLGAYRDVGGIAGYVAWSTTIKDNSVKNIEITVDQMTNHYGDYDFNAGAVWGRNSVSDGGVGVTAEGNTSENVSIESTYSKDGITYKNDGVTGETTLYLVPSDYEGTTVNVPEGVDVIGGYAFAYNSGVEKIVLSDTVTTLKDRAFRDTTASEVVLNEGLTNISYQAFRNALNVTSVEIPSTVTTISKEAFQNSGVKTLTIPASVTTIEYGGLRDMKMLESVTVEGNVNIPVYAFRACTNLKTVILKGDDVTFGEGTRGMIFTNKENGDGSAITVYVSNETVKERLLAADTAAKDYGGYKIIVGEANTVSTSEALSEALANGGNVIITENIEMEAATTAPYGNKYAVKLDGGVLDGNGNELYMECYGDDYGIMTSGGTIKNLTIQEGCRAVMIMYATEDVILDNVNIGGDGVLYPINTGEAGEEGVKLTVTNSTLAGWTSFSNIESASFTNVKFEQGTYYNNIYGRVLKPYVNTTLTDCDFVEHMNLDLSGLTNGHKITIKNCTVNGHKITIKNCTVNGQSITEETFTIPANDEDYDTKLFTVDLPSWAKDISDCIVFN